MDSKSIIIIGLLVLIAILIGVWVSLLNTLAGYQSVSNVSFTKNTVLDIQKAVIYPSNPYGVFPNDKLLLQITLSKEISSLVTIKPLIYTTVGGEPVKTSEDQKWQSLESDQPETFSYEFYAGTEGQNIVKVAINTTNPNDLPKERFALFVNGTSNSFEVSSTSDRLLSSQNIMILIGILVSAVGSAIALSLTAFQTKLSRDEKKETQRAWIGDTGSKIMVFRIINDKGEALSKAEWNTMTPQDQISFDPSEYQYYMKLKNFGQVTAVNVKGRYEICLDIVPARKKIESAMFGVPFVLLPGDEQYYIITISRDIGDILSKGNRKLYLINEIVYNSGISKKIFKYGFISEISRPAYFKIDSWDETSYSKEP